MTDRTNTIVGRVIEAAGSVGALADALGVTPGAISQWKHVPVDRVLVVERLTGIPRSEIRPDIYPPDEYPPRAA